MNIVADEGVDKAVVDRLRLDGHDVFYAAEDMAGTTDDDLLRRTADRGALLITADKDFGELVFRRKSVHSGVLLLRLEGLSNAAKAKLVSDTCQSHESALNQSFSVLGPGQLRVRPTI